MNSTNGPPRVCKTIARMDDLHARLLAAHEADDRHALVKLYTEAAPLGEVFVHPLELSGAPP